VVNGVSHAYVEDGKNRLLLRSGFAAEGVAGIIGVVLTILGLLGVASEMLLPIATIVLGVAFVTNGSSVAARFSKLLNETAKGRFASSEFSIGLTTEFIGGIAAIILGVLTLLHISASILMPVSAIVFGAALLFGSGLMARLNHLQMPKSEGDEEYREIAREAVTIATGVEILLGLGAAVLGIIALVGVQWMALTFVALLCVGVSNVTSGSAIIAKLASAPHKKGGLFFFNSRGEVEEDVA
jgi:hypothetical protein